MQIVEYNTPEKLLLDKSSAFSKMVQSTGDANAQYLCSLVFGGEGEANKRLDGQRRGQGSSIWTNAAQLALGVNLSSSKKHLLQLFETEDDNNIINKTKDAVITLEEVLEGKHDTVIEECLSEQQIPADIWWSALYRMIEGII